MVIIGALVHGVQALSCQDGELWLYVSEILTQDCTQVSCHDDGCLSFESAY